MNQPYQRVTSDSVFDGAAFGAAVGAGGVGAAHYFTNRAAQRSLENARMRKPSAAAVAPAGLPTGPAVATAAASLSPGTPRGRRTGGSVATPNVMYGTPPAALPAGRVRGNANTANTSGVINMGSGGSFGRDNILPVAGNGAPPAVVGGGPAAAAGAAGAGHVGNGHNVIDPPKDMSALRRQSRFFGSGRARALSYGAGILGMGLVGAAIDGANRS